MGQMLAEYQAQSDVPQEVCDQILEAAKESSVGEDGVRSQVKIRKPKGKNHIRYEYDLDHIDCEKNEITFYRHINHSDGSRHEVQYVVGIEEFVNAHVFDSEKVGGEEGCFFTDNASPGLVATYQAACVDGVANFHISMKDSSLGTPLYGSGCDQMNCGHIISVPCRESMMCDEEEPQRALEVSEETNTTEHVAAHHEGVADSPTEDSEDVPYCISVDYPCEGEEEDMVYVCHYSTRKGYQTFCIPEEDSDIVRFYPHDYCGPCEGGYGGATWS